MGHKKESKNPPKPPNFVGIKNIGNTCFLNCVLQQIHMAPKIRDAVLAIEPTSTISPERRRGKVSWWSYNGYGYILDHETNSSIRVNQAGLQVKYLETGQEVEYEIRKNKRDTIAIYVTVVSTEEKDDDTYLCHLQSILKDLDDKNQDIKTNKLCHSFKWISHNPSGLVTQDDAHGFFCALFQRIDDENINELLRVKVIKTHLLKCQHIYTTNEDLFALSIPMSTSDGEAPALSDLLDAYFEKDDRKKKCFECGSKTQQGEIMKYFENTPEILCIHINRIDGSITEDIAVNQTLDIAHLLPPKDNDRRSRLDIKASYVENILSSSGSRTSKTSLLSCRQFTFTLELHRNKKPLKITVEGLPKLQYGITELKSVKNFASYPAGVKKCFVSIDEQTTTINWAKSGEKNIVEFQVNIETRSNVVPKVQILIELYNGNGHLLPVDPEDPAPRRRYSHYSIAGLLIHRGNKNAGHYFSLIKCRKGHHKGTWWEFNDNSVNKIDGGIERERRMKCGAVMAIYEPTPRDQLPRKSSTPGQSLKAAGDMATTSDTDVLPPDTSCMAHTSRTGDVTFSATSQDVTHTPNPNSSIPSGVSVDGTAGLVDVVSATQTEVKSPRMEAKSTQTEDKPAHIDGKSTQEEGDFENLPPLERIPDSSDSKQYEQLPTAEQVSSARNTTTISTLPNKQKIDPKLRILLQLGKLLRHENYFKKSYWTYDLLREQFMGQDLEIQFDEVEFFQNAGINDPEERRIFRGLLTDYPDINERFTKVWKDLKKDMVKRFSENYFDGNKNEAEICLRRLMFGDMRREFSRKEAAPGRTNV